MSTAGTKELIEQGVRRFQAEVPAFAQLKLVFALELRGRRDVQLYRVEVPGPKVVREDPADATVRLSVARSHFNELVADGNVKHWREAFEEGHAKASGPDRILRLVASVVDRHEQRARTPKVSP